MNAISQKAMGADRARELTIKIKSATYQLWSLLLEAHEGKAWKALGYASWEAYIDAEFDMSRQYAYRLLDHGRVIRALEEAAGESVAHGRQITERVSRDIKPVLPDVTREIRERVEAGGDPIQTTYEVIEAKRVERKEEAKPATELVSPAVNDEDEDDGAPSDEEIAAALATEAADRAAFEKLLASDDALRDAYAEIKRLNAVVVGLNARINGLVNEKDQAVRMAKSWQRKAIAAGKAAA